MNPESQPGVTPDEQKLPEPPVSAPVPDAPQEPQSPEPQTTATAPAQVEPEEQHFFRSDSQTPVASNTYSPAPSPSAVVPGETEFLPLNPRMQDDGQAVDWTALEFIYHEKSQQWYTYFVAGCLALIVIVAVITRSIISIVIDVLICTIFGIGASRKPRELHYAVDIHGITSGRSFHTYSDFRGFTMAPEGGLVNMTLLPLKRFMPPMSIYFDPADQERIMAVVSNHLPLENHQPDVIERLMSRIRF